MLKVILDERLHDQDALAEMTTGHEVLTAFVRDVDLDRAARETGIARPQIVSLARDFATAPTAAAYGRCGASLGPFATLAKYLIDALNIATGNLDRPGGWCFGHPMLDTEKLTSQLKISGYDRWRTRIDDFPEVMSTSPVAALPREIRTPGKGQLRAMVIGSGNPATTGPAAGEIDSALQELDLLVCIDPSVTETGRHADYVLPPSLWLEREELPVFTQAHSAVPYAQWVPATVPPPGEAQADWWIIDEICKRIRIVPSAAPGAQLLGRLGIRPKPAAIVDLAVRIGSDGDLFGLRPRGISRRKLLANPGGTKLADGLPTGVLRKRVRHRDRRVHLDHPVIKVEMERLVGSAEGDDPEYPLRLFSVRELRSHNSWLHNVPKLMVGDRVQRMRVHPDDAAELRIDDEDDVEVASRHGKIIVRVRASDEVMRGSVGLPQGWGHRGGWRTAVAAGGSGCNQLTTNAPSEVDRPSGNAVLNGVAVRVRPLSVTHITEKD